MQQFNLKNRPDIFNNLNTAKTWAADCIKLHIVLESPMNTYFVVNLRDANKLIEQGFKKIS